MSNLIDRGQAALNRRMGQAAGRAVTYTRSATALALTPWVGRTVFASNLDGGARIEFGERDYLFAAADLAALGTPAIGDRVTETIAGVDAVFEVATPTTGEPAWRYSDQTRTVFRVHCKKVG